MLLLALFGCRGYFDSVPPEVITDEIVGRWWYLTGHEGIVVDNFYLEPVETDAGDVWLDFIGGPTERLGANIFGGTWSLTWDGAVQVVDEYFDTEGTYDIVVQEAVDHGCYDVVLHWNFRITDTICPYEE